MQRQKEITKDLKARAERVAETTLLLEQSGVPLPDKSIQNAIKEGANRNIAQAEKGFEEAAPNMVDCL